MKKIILTLLIGIFVFSGCGITEWATSDINGWDFSACFSSFTNFSVCNELFWDNYDIIQEQNTVELVFPNGG